MKNTCATTAALALLGAILLPTPTPANTAESLLANDANGTSSITGTTNWSPATTVPPIDPLASTYDYSVTAFALRTPTGSGNYTIQANSVTINAGGSLVFKGGGTNTFNNLVLNGGTINHNGTGVPAGPPDTAWLAGNINLTANSTLTPSTSTGTNQFLTILAPITNATSANLTVDGSASAAGSGTLVLAAQNTFKGNITVNNKTPGVILRLGVDNALPSGTGLTLSGGSSSSPVFDLNGHSTTVSNLTLSSGTTTGIVTNSAPGSISTLTLGYNNATETLAYGTITDNPSAAGTVALTKIGAGTLSLSIAYAYSGDTTVSAGTVKMGASNLLPNGAGKGNLIVNGTLDLSGRAETVNGLSGSGTIDNSGGTAGAGYVLTVGNNDASSTFNGAIQNTLGSAYVALTKMGAGALYLTGNNSFNGNVIIATGAVWIATSGALGVGPKNITIRTYTTSSELHLNGTNGDISLASGLSFFTGNSIGNGALVNEAGANTINGTVSLSTGGSTLVTVNGGSLTLAGNINISTGTSSRPLTLGGAANGIVSGAMANGTGGILSLIKTGAGTWTLSNANTYSDVTTISAGTLALSGGGSVNNTPSISVASGAIFDVSANAYNLGTGQDLSGKGTVAGSDSSAVTLNGTVHPGGNAVVGTLAFTGAGGLSLGGTANATFDLGSLPGTVGGTANDLITVAGPLTIGGTLTINSSALVAGTYTLFTCSGTPSGSATIVFAGGSIPSGYTLNLVPGAVTLTVSFTTPTATGIAASPSSGWTYGSPITFTATVSPTPPDGATVNFYDGVILIGTGILSGGQAAYTTTPATQLAVGSHSISAGYPGGGSYGASSSSALNQSVGQKSVVPSVTVNDKTYDGNATATISTRSLSGVVGSEDVSLGSSGTAAFTDATAGNNKTANITDLSLSGADAGHYVLSATATSATANIAPAGLTVSGITANSKVYDQTAIATLDTSGATLVGVIAPDAVSLDVTAATAIFASTNAANNITVTVTGLALSGAQKDNYTLMPLTGLAADITPAGSSLALTSSANPSQIGDAVTFTAALSAVAPGAGLPGGVVQFLTNGMVAGDPVALSNAVASLSLAGLPGGAQTVTAEYAGDGNFLGSTNSLAQVVNRPPLASDLTLGAISGVSATVQVIGGKHAPTDPDNDSLLVTAVSSPANGSASTDGTGITYTSSEGFSGTDGFTYTVSDGQGGTATSSVTVQVSAGGQGYNLVSGPTPMGGGVYRITYQGIPTLSYALEQTTSLDPPDWTPLATNQASATGQLVFTLPLSGDSGYYRTRYVP